MYIIWQHCVNSLWSSNGLWPWVPSLLSSLYSGSPFCWVLSAYESPSPLPTDELQKSPVLCCAGQSSVCICLLSDGDIAVCFWRQPYITDSWRGPPTCEKLPHPLNDLPHTPRILMLAKFWGINLWECKAILLKRPYLFIYLVTYLFNYLAS